MRKQLKLYVHRSWRLFSQLR